MLVNRVAAAEASADLLIWLISQQHQLLHADFNIQQLDG